MPDLPDGWAREALLGSRPGRFVVRARRGPDAPVVLKGAPPGAGWAARAALRREARVLDGVRGDGVVDLLGVVDRGGRTVLVLAFVPAGSLVDRPAPDPEAVARHLEATIHRIHRAGFVHDALRPEHVLLDADGLPVLVGFGSAHPSKVTGPDRSALADLRRSPGAGARSGPPRAGSGARTSVRGPGGEGRPRSPSGRRGGRRRP